MSCIIKYKDTNLKAIHNRQELDDAKAKLYYQIQRYKFESNSQPTYCCFRCRTVVLSNTKIQIWKQFTTNADATISGLTLYYQIQRYKFESNSQLRKRWHSCTTGCIIKYKDTNLKAIHNWHARRLPEKVLYYQIQRYKFESNSQLWRTWFYYWYCCIIKYKDTNLKAIHNFPQVAEFH